MGLQRKSLTLLLLFLGVLALGFILYTEQIPDKEAVFQEAFEDATAMNEKGALKSYLIYEKALRNATSVEEEARAKLNVGTAYFRVDTVKAIETLKEIYVNENYPPAIRAAAAHGLMEWYSLSDFGPAVLDTVGKKVFTGGDPWESYYVNEGGKEFTRRDATLSMRNLAEDSADRIVSLFQSEYAIAYIYSALEAKDNIENPKELKRYVDIVHERIARGDKAITNNSSRRDSQYGWGYYYRAFALDNLYRAGVDVTEINALDIDATYEKATSFRESVARSPTSFPTRLRHILFLGHLKLNKKAQEKLIEISTRAGVSSEARDKYITALVNVASDPWYMDSLEYLASVDATFKEVLISVGWKQKK